MRHFTIGIFILIIMILNPITLMVKFGLSVPVPYEYPGLFTYKFYILIGFLNLLMLVGVVYLIKNKLSNKDLIIIIIPIVIIITVFNWIFNVIEREKMVNNVLKSESFRGVEDIDLLKKNVIKFFSDDLRHEYKSLYESHLMPFYQFDKYSTERVLENSYIVRTTVKSIIRNNRKPVIIWFFGGSTMHSIYTLDNHTIPSFVTKNFDSNNVKIEAINFGVSSLNTSYELFNFIQLLKNTKLKPDVVVFYDGYNDALSYLAFGETHIEIKGRKAVPIEFGYFDNAVFNISQMFSKHSILYKKMIGDGIYYGYYNRFKYEFSERKIAAAVDNYMKNIHLISSIARDYGVIPIFILQPMPFTKEYLTEDEKKHWLGVESEFYNNGKIIYDRIRLLNKNNMSFYDFSYIFNGNKSTLYFDQGHVSATGNKIIGKEVFSVLNKILR